MKIRFLLIIFLLIIVGCQSEAPPDSLTLLEAQPTQLSSTDAESVATTFLQAWKRRDYSTMYSLITPNARDRFTQSDFVAIYDEVTSQVGLRDISWQITAGPLVEGTSAHIEYTMTFETGLLGTFSDPNPEFAVPIPREMNLVSVSGEGWRIAWSRADIFSGWENNASLQFIRTMPRRGNIYDRNGIVLVSQEGSVIGIQLVKNRMPDQTECANQIARVLDLPLDEVTSYFDRFNEDVLFQVGEVNQDTISIEHTVLENTCRYISNPRPSRIYHEPIAAPHLIGYVGKIPTENQATYLAQGYPEDAIVGLAGIEAAFEPELRGKIGIELIIRSTAGFAIRTVAKHNPEAGQSVYLTIDRDFQLAAEALLADAYENGKATWSTISRGGSLVVMDIHTGSILAMVSYPDFDPAIFNPDSVIPNSAAQVEAYQIDPRTPLVNRVTSGRYPLGSVFKVFSMITGLDSGVWAAGNYVYCSGRWDGTGYNDIVRTDWYTPGHGGLDMKGGLINSCNPYFWQMSVTLNNSDPNLLPSYAKRMGFGQPVPFQNLPTDSGFIPDPAWEEQFGRGFWTQPDSTNLVIGQGIMTVTPLQVVRATAMVANGGTLYNPIIVHHVGYYGAEPSIVYQPQGQNLGFDPDVLALVREAMCEVTETSRGTANYIFYEWYELNDYQIIACGKTGTAQSGQSRPHAWFTAFAPKENPQIAIVAMAENSCEGSEVAAPIVQRTLELYYPQLRSIGWPDLWYSGCTTIGPT